MPCVPVSINSTKRSLAALLRLFELSEVTAAADQDQVPRRFSASSCPVRGAKSADLLKALITNRGLKRGWDLYRAHMSRRTESLGSNSAQNSRRREEVTLSRASVEVIKQIVSRTRRSECFFSERNQAIFSKTVLRPSQRRWSSCTDSSPPASKRSRRWRMKSRRASPRAADCSDIGVSFNGNVDRSHGPACRCAGACQ